MSESLFSIGQFARVGDLPTSVLRYYDEVGLLPAAHVDATTGYRFYDAQQQSQARLLARLREAELPIDTMRRLLTLEDAALAAALDEIAADQLRTASRRAALLRQLASEAARPQARECRLVVDPAVLADGLGRVLPLVGPHPFDAVLLCVDPWGLTALGTDRYRLAMLRCPAAVPPVDAPADAAPVRLLLAATDADRIAEHVAAADGPLEVTATSAGLVVGGEDVASRVLTDFPDLVFLDAEFAAKVRGRRLVTRDAFEVDDESLVLEVSGDAVRLTASLAREAVATLVGPQVLLEVASPASPVVVSSPSRPGHRVAVMPRRS